VGLLRVGWLSSFRLGGRLFVVALALAAVLAGCGSSGGSSTITVGNEKTTDNALVSSSEKSTSTITTTPTSGALSKEPKVTPLSGPAPTKLETKDLIFGTGAEAKAGDKVSVNYVGALYKGGKEFEASWKRKEPFPFTLGKGEVIKGWDQGIVGMKVGGRRELIIPASLAYGAAGRPPSIPRNEALVFVVDLLGV
jgi:peptidylprolyl isomerase